MKRNNYSNSKYVWLEKDLEKNLEKNLKSKLNTQKQLEEKDSDPESPTIKNTLSFDKEEFENAVKPIILPLIKSSLKEIKNENETNVNQTNTLQNPSPQKNKVLEGPEVIKHVHSKQSIPLWVPLLLGILGTSTFFLFIIVCIIFKCLHTIQNIHTIHTTLNQLK